jgi:hypothetical protein
MAALPLALSVVHVLRLICFVEKSLKEDNETQAAK